MIRDDECELNHVRWTIGTAGLVAASFALHRRRAQLRDTREAHASALQARLNPSGFD
jgi:hypothetical protein